MTVADLSRLLRGSSWAIYADVANHRIPALRVCGSIRFSRAAIEAWLQERAVKPVCTGAD